jgi:hypothetical protein
MTWSQGALKGVVPSPRAGQTANVVSDKLIVFGGGDGIRMFNDLYVLDPTTFGFTRPMIVGVAPTGRCAHTATLWEGKLVIFGGGDGGRRFKDLLLIDVGQYTHTLYVFQFHFFLCVFLLFISHLSPSFSFSVLLLLFLVVLHKYPFFEIETFLKCDNEIATKKKTKSRQAKRHSEEKPARAKGTGCNTRRVEKQEMQEKRSEWVIQRRLGQR